MSDINGQIEVVNAKSASCSGWNRATAYAIDGNKL